MNLSEILLERVSHLSENSMLQISKDNVNKKSNYFFLETSGKFSIKSWFFPESAQPNGDLGGVIFVRSPGEKDITKFHTVKRGQFSRYTELDRKQVPKDVLKAIENFLAKK